MLGTMVYRGSVLAPEFFVRESYPYTDKYESGSGKIDLKVWDAGEKLDIPESTINKAPVVLLHGLWDNASCWDDFKDKLKNDDGYKYINAFSYTNFVHFKQNSWVIDTAIKMALQSCKDDGIVAKKADVVAHRMGGILTKLYGNASNIKSITTVGTPHLGSECADILYQLVDDADSN